MAKRKKKKSGMGKKGLKRPILLSGLIAGILIVFSFFYIVSRSKSTFNPVYEERYSGSTPFEKEIVRIDGVIYSTLYKRGIPDSSIYFQSVSPMYDRGSRWDLTEILIKIPDLDGVRELYQTIKEKLDAISPGVHYRVEQRAHNGWIFHVFAKSFYTHKITISARDEKIKPSDQLPTVSIIIDDLGYDPGIIDNIVNLDFPFSLSILPIAPYTKSTLEKAAKNGFELMLHLPMEPKNYPSLNPGPGALLTGMNNREIRSMLERNLRLVPGIRGVNNHMGSFFTERSDKMAVVLNELKGKGLFFVDSRTTSKTVAFKLAKKLKIPAGERSVFLDNETVPAAIGFQMERLIGIARNKGSAIGIAHPRKKTLDYFKKNLPRLRKKARFIPVSKLVS